MKHKPIKIRNLEFSLPHKICFENFNNTIYSGDHIAIIGCNGSGKSLLLKIMQGKIEPTAGEVKLPEDINFGYVAQIIEDFNSLSGAERFNAALTEALSLTPNLLMLDEPTNHLDLSNRKSLMRMLSCYHGTLIIVSHDTELLRTCINKIWHIDNGHIQVFSGNYDDYMKEINTKCLKLEQELSHIEYQKKVNHQNLMEEQERAKNSRVRGEKHIAQRKWPTIVSTAKARRAEATSGRKKNDIRIKKQELTAQLLNLRLPEVIRPKFSIPAADIREQTILAISNGSIGYNNQQILKYISLSLSAGERIAIIGDNGSGKSTLIKGILNNTNIIKTGDWYIPKQKDIGYLDQHYCTLNSQETVFKTIQHLVPNWTHAEIRKHLNDFLFRKNEEVNTLVTTLSGGERTRLSLAQIAALTPKLLILDEITNNIDLETRTHIIQVLQAYPGALIVISHDKDFLKRIKISSYYKMHNGTLSLV